MCVRAAVRDAPIATVSDTHLTPSVEAIGSDTVPLEVSEVAGQPVDVGLGGREHVRFQEFVEYAELDVRREIRIDRWRGQPFLLKSAKASRKAHERGLPELGERRFEARVDRVRFVQDDSRGVAVSGERLQPRSETGFEDRPRAVRTCLDGRGVERLEGAFDAIVEIVEHGQEDPLLAREVEVEGAAGDAGAGDDVRDTGPPVTLPGKDPRVGVQQLLPTDFRLEEDSTSGRLH